MQEYDEWCLKQDSFAPQIEQAKEIIDNAVRLFNGDIPELNELSKGFDGFTVSYVYSGNQ